MGSHGAGFRYYKKGKTLRAMVVVGLVLRLLAIALPGMHIAMIVFAAVLVAWSVFHLLVEQ